MLSSRASSCSTTDSKQRKHLPVERRPRMLKDFLTDDLNSCSSSGFKLFRRRAEDHSIRNLIQNDVNMAKNASLSPRKSTKLIRSRSKAAASTTISAFQAIINTVRSIQFSVAKSPSILPRSLSRKLSKKNRTKSENKDKDVTMTVRVKDIIRWKSFRDLIDEKPQPLDLAFSPDHHCATTTTTTTTTTTGSSNSTPCSSNASSWCDSDFTSEYLPSWSGNSEEYGENDVELGKKILPCVGRDSMKATTETTVGPKEESAREEKEQRSPISSLDFEDDEDEDSPASFNQSLANMEKRKEKLMQKIHRFEILANLDPTNFEQWMPLEEREEGYADDEEEEAEDRETNEVEEKAKLLLNHVRAASPLWSCEDSSIALEQLLLDLFVDELSRKRYQSADDDIDEEIIRQAREWMKGEQDTTVDREACLRDMDKRESRSKLEKEQEELTLQIENGLLNLLVDELLTDLL